MLARVPDSEDSHTLRQETLLAAAGKGCCDLSDRGEDTASGPGHNAASTNAGRRKIALALVRSSNAVIAAVSTTSGYAPLTNTHKASMSAIWKDSIRGRRSTSTAV